MTKNFIITFSALVIFSLIFSTVTLAKDFELPDAGITPDSPFYFIKSWKEKIQLFFTFNTEQKAKQYLHLAGVRLAEYQKMLEKNKTEIAEKTLNKYQNQLNRALEKANELKEKNKDIKDLTEKIKEITSKHLEVLQKNLEKVPEQARKGIETAIENSGKQIEKILGMESKIIIKQSGGAAILIAECADRVYITKTADYIVKGTIQKVESKWNEEKTSIFTYSDLLIEKYIKGKPFAENKIQIITPGGTVGEITQWVEDQPIFHEGKKVIVYFIKRNGEFEIICGGQGVEESLSTQPCTQEAKICPDGTSVGRTGPNCEFAECPGEKSSPPQVKLESILYQLTQSSDYYDFANKHDLDVINGKVRVSILLNNIAYDSYNLSADFGIKEIGFGNTLQALIRVDKLLILADDPNVLFIRRPNKAIPQL